MNRGYWVWLIPLGSGNTSVGIVTDESIHPQATYGQSFNQSMEWLRVNEPALHEYLQGREPMDFLTLKNFSYTSAQVFSHHRWSCVGEAGVFLDLFYSVGSDYIAMANTIRVELIRRDRAGELTAMAIGTFNKFFLEILFNTWLRYYQGTYNIFGHAHIFTPKHAWDIGMYWAWTYQLYVQGP
jgi:flavin-dependent dehydrogenase